MEELRLYLTAIGILIALIALFIAIRNFRRKTGIFVRGSFGICESIYCAEPYISNVILENLKDRSITIFAIYLRLGRSYYIKLEDFESKPLILKPYETYHKEYGPIEFYSVNMRKILIGNIIKNYSIKKSIYLSTSDGKYRVPSFIKHWDPTYETFANPYSAVIYPIKNTYKNIHIGSNAKFIIEFIHDDGKEEITQIRQDDYQLKVFNNFQLTKHSLTSAAALTELIEEQISSENISCKKFKIYDIDEFRNKYNIHYNTSPFEAPSPSFLRYYFLGVLPAMLSHLIHYFRNIFRRTQ